MRTQEFANAMVSSVMLAIVWAALYGSRPATAAGSHRSPNEVNEDKELSGFDLKTTGQKRLSGEYQTLSSSQEDQQHDDHGRPLVQADDSRPEGPEMNEGRVEPLTADTPPLLARSKYVKIPAIRPYSGGRSTGYYRDDIVDDPSPEYSTNTVKFVPKWNRYRPGNGRLKKYGIVPVTVEMDVAADGNSGGVGEQYDSAVDYSYGGANYYNPDGHYKSSDDGGYAEAAGHDGGEVLYSEGPAILQAASRLPKVSTGAQQKLGWLVIASLAVAKLLMTVKAVKFFALSAIKLKLLVLFKLFLYANWYAASKFFKLVFVPFAPSLLKNLLMALMPSSSMTPMMAMMMPTATSSDAGGTAGTSRNSSSAEPAYARSSTAAITENLLQLMVAISSSAECAERLACHVAGTGPQSFQSLWTDWILSYLVNYIPNQKFKSYVSTFKDVSDYRSENIFNNPSTKEWLKWCDERYFCSDDASVNNSLV